MEETNLYYKLGGQKAIRAVVEEFYRRMLEDELVNRGILGIDMDRLRTHQKPPSFPMLSADPSNMTEEPCGKGTRVSTSHPSSMSG